MSNQKLKYHDGRVVRIRVNPKDCMGAVDVLKSLGLIEPGMSFSVVISTALFYLLKTARENGIIPNRDGFEYGEMMAMFKDQPHLDRTRKIAITQVFQMAQRPVEEVSRPFSTNPRIAMLERQLAELVAKAEVDPLNADADEMNSLREEILRAT